MNRLDDLRDDLKRLNELLERQNRLEERRLDWKTSLRHGLLVGLGSVIGATILVSLFVWLLRPFQRVDFIRPAVERVLDDLDRERAFERTRE